MSTEKTADEKPKRGWWPFGGSSSGQVEDEAEDQVGVSARKGRATPGRRVSDDEEGNLVTRGAGGIREYFEGVVAELQKVTWPTREEARRLSAIVLAATLLASIILGAVAFGYSELFRLGLTQPIIFLGFFVIVVAAGFVLYRRSTSRNTPPTY